jgi:hypothetical protein
LKTIDIASHFSEFDRSILEGENAYVDYFNHLKFALDSLLSSLPGMKSDNPYEIDIIKDYCQKFLNTIEVFKIKYAFSDNPMLVDVTESGFPNFLEFKRLGDDLNKKDERLRSLPIQESLKGKILDYMIQNHEHPYSHLKQLSQVVYFESITEWKMFTEFTPGKLQLIKTLKDDANTRRFLYSWASFDSVTNRPIIYLMVFDNPMYINKKRTDVEHDEDFVEQIRKITHNSAPLKVIASDIDSAYESIKPKILKRIAIGPIFGYYARDEHPHTTMLKDHFQSDDMIFTYDSEVIFSVGEKRTNSFLSKGELRQIFYIDEANKECMDRMVSKVFSYMITSHRVLQFLNTRNPEVIKSLSSPPFIYSR